MLKSVIFDLDGVVADSHPLHMRAWRRFLLTLGITVNDEQLEFVRDGRKRQDILRYFVGELTDDQVHSYGRKKDLFFHEECKSLVPIEGVERLLQDLNRAAVLTAVASSGSRSRVHHILNLLELKSHFAAVVTGDEVKDGKPDPAIFHRVAEQMQVRPEESLVFEDSVSGVRAAKAAGMECVGIAEEHRARLLLGAGATYVCRNFVDTSLSQIRELFS